MKVSRKQAAENRERILDTAAQLFREKGFDGIGIADLMKSAGLTHGGFYNQFTSKEDLAAQASARAMAQTGEYWDRMIEQEADPWHIFVDRYLSPTHRDNPGRGCTYAALGAEAQRHDPAVRKAFTEGLQKTFERLASIVPESDQGTPRQHAMAGMAALVGAVVLARAVDDPALAEEIVEAVRGSL